MPHDSSLALADRLGISAYDATVVRVAPLSGALLEVVLSCDTTAAGIAGNDVMLLVPTENGAARRRRYSVRAVDHESGTLTLWASTAHEGPGVSYLTSLEPGTVIDLVGPRGKITLDPLADWHLFVGDLSALGSFYRLAESIDVPGRAIFIVETPSMDAVVTTTFQEGLGVTGIFVEQGEHDAGSADTLLAGLAAFAFPPDEGHAYVFAEFSAVKTVATALLDRGLSSDSIETKAFWRRGRVNADHGEPDKGD